MDKVICISKLFSSSPNSPQKPSSHQQKAEKTISDIVTKILSQNISIKKLSPPDSTSLHTLESKLKVVASYIQEIGDSFGLLIYFASSLHFEADLEAIRGITLLYGEEIYPYLTIILMAEDGNQVSEEPKTLLQDLKKFQLENSHDSFYWKSFDLAVMRQVLPCANSLNGNLDDRKKFLSQNRVLRFLNRFLSNIDLMELQSFVDEEESPEVAKLKQEILKIPKKLLDKIEEIKSTQNSSKESESEDETLPKLVQIFLCEAFQALTGEIANGVIVKSPLYLMLSQKFDFCSYAYEGKTQFEFEPELDNEKIPLLIKELSDFILFEDICKFLERSKKSDNFDDIINQIESFLKENPFYLDFECSSEKNFLVLFIKIGKMEGIMMMVEEFKSDVNLYFGRYRNNPLIEAAKSQNDTVYEYLVKHGADENQKNEKGVCAKDLIQNKTLKTKWHYSDSSFTAFTSFQESDVKLIQKAIEEEKSSLEIELENIKYKVDLNSFTLKPLKDGKELLIRYVGFPGKTMKFLKGDTEEDKADKIRWQLLMPDENGVKTKFDCTVSQNKSITSAFLKREKSCICEFRFENIYEAICLEEGDNYGEKVQNNQWRITLNFENFTWNFFNADKKGEFRWLPLLQGDVLSDAKVDDLVSSGAVWQYISNDDLTISSFTESQFKTISEKALSKPSAFKVSDMDSELDISLKDFSVIQNNKSGMYYHKLRYIGPFPTKMHVFTKKKKDTFHEVMKWQLLFLDKGKVVDFNLTEENNLLLTKSYVDGKDSISNIFLNLSFKMTHTYTQGEKFGNKKTESSWNLNINLVKFTFSDEETSFNGLVRWVPFEEDDIIEQLTITPDKELIKSKEDDLIESDESDKNQIKKFFEPPKTKTTITEEPEEEEDPNLKTYKGKGAFAFKLEPYFELNPLGHISQSGQDLIVQGSEQFIFQVESIMNFLSSDSKEIETEKRISHTFYKQGHLFDVIKDFHLCQKPFFAEKDDKALIVRVTPEQLIEINDLIKALSQSQEDQAANPKVYDKVFGGAVFFVNEIRKRKYHGKKVTATESGKNLIISGTLSQLQQARIDIEELTKDYQKKWNVEPFLVLGKGHLAEDLKEEFGDSIGGSKVSFSKENDNLKIVTFKIVYDWILGVLPVFEDKIKKDKEKRMVEEEIKGLISKQDKFMLFKVHIISKKVLKPMMSYFSIFVGKLTEREKLTATDIKIQLKANIFFKNDPDFFTVGLVEATETQIKSFQEEINKAFVSYKKAKIILDSVLEGLKEAKEWSKCITSRNNLQGERWKIWKGFREIFDPLFVEEFKTENEKILQIIISKTKDMYHSDHIDPEVLFQQILLEIGQFDEFDSKELKKKIVEQLKDVAQKATIKYIDKMKEDTLNEMRLEGKKPSDEALKTLNEIIKKKITGLNQIVYAAKHQEFYDLLYRIQLFMKGFKINLPIFKDLPEIFEKLESSQILLVKVSTGSGKSTLIPPLLLADRYKKVVVTQPRRLPCRAISNRVNSTFHKKISGWAVSGQSVNGGSQLTYMTDGLLKEVIMYSQYENRELPYDVIILDEIHERGKNIDLCLATLSLRLQTDKNLKVILCSATVDESIKNRFEGISIKQFVVDMKNPLIEDAPHGGKSMLGLAAELSKKLKVGQKILCFLPSTKDVREACDTFSEKYNRVGYPLIANQPGNVQEEYLQEGQVFFSTTIAETSITFPGSLCYVIDSGKIRTPYYDPSSKLTYLREFDAAQSTLIQRKGRLGRTNFPGKYILMNPEAKRDSYPLTELEKIDLTDTYFGVLRSTQGKVKETNKIFDAIPTIRPDEMKKKRDDAMNELERLGIIKDEKMTTDGRAIVSLPIRGSAKMAKAVFTGITQNSCGKDMILLAAAFVVLDQGFQSLLKAAKNFTSRENGDFDTLLKLLRAVLKKESEYGPKMDYKKMMNEIGMGSTGDIDYISRLLKDIIEKYHSYVDEIGKSDKLKIYIPNVVHLVSLGNGSWESVGKSLVSGFFDQTFVNSAYLGDSEDYYLRLVTDFKQKVMLSPDSGLYTGGKQTKTNYILVKDIMFVQFDNVLEDYGNISVAGRIEPNWLTHTFKKSFKIDDDEMAQIQASTDPSIKPLKTSSGYNIEVSGQAGKVIEYERNSIESMKVPKHEIDLGPKIKALCDSNKNMSSIYEENFQKIKDDHGRIFRGIFRKWEKLAQVKISFHKTGKIEIVNARKYVIKDIETQMTKFVDWFKNCNLINCKGIKGYPHTLDKNMPEYKAIRTRIERITNPDLDYLELKNYASGPNSTRTSRMELVCWLLINHHDCTVEGGFIRDWVVAGRSEWKDGIKLKPVYGKWDFDAADQPFISPKDLDVYMSMDKPFDKEKFKREVTKLGLTVEFDESDGWRTYCVFDKKGKWPFTADLIEPYQQVCQDTVDMDVSDLYVKSSYTGELGLRIPLDDLEVQDDKNTSITVEMIIKNIQDKKFTVLRPRDTTARIKKFVDRGWTQNTIKIIQKAGEESIITLRYNDPLYQYAVQMMSKLAGAKILKVSVVGSSSLDKIYQGQRENMIKANKGDINEMTLYHGTGYDAVRGIIKTSFDNRYTRAGNWGNGFYFADDPNKANGYAPADGNGVKHMLLCKVLLGKKNIMKERQNTLNNPGIGYDSVMGTAYQFTEYIVYRYGQAKPYLWVEYKV